MRGTHLIPQLTYAVPSCQNSAYACQWARQVVPRVTRGLALGAVEKRIRAVADATVGGCGNPMARACKNAGVEIAHDHGASALLSLSVSEYMRSAEGECE